MEVVLQNQETIKPLTVDEQKKKDMQYGKQILVAHNLEGNMDEPFIGMKGTVTRVKKNDWYEVILFEQTHYGKRFNFHIDELEIL
jgi:hypothetical protein